MYAAIEITTATLSGKKKKLVFSLAVRHFGTGEKVNSRGLLLKLYVRREVDFSLTISRVTDLRSGTPLSPYEPFTKKLNIVESVHLTNNLMLLHMFQSET